MICLKKKDVGLPELELIFSQYKNLFYKKIDVACGLFNLSNDRYLTWTVNPSKVNKLSFYQMKI